MMNPDVPGDKWTRGGWGASGSQKLKRETNNSTRIEHKDSDDSGSN